MPRINLDLDFDQVTQVIDQLSEEEKKKLCDRLNKPPLQKEAYLKLVSLGESDSDDVSEHHDKYLGEAIADEHLR